MSKYKSLQRLRRNLSEAQQKQDGINDDLIRQQLILNQLADNLNSRLILLRKTLDRVILADPSDLEKLRIDAAVNQVRDGIDILQDPTYQQLTSPRGAIPADLQIFPVEGTGDLFEDTDSFVENTSDEETII